MQNRTPIPRDQRPPLPDFAPVPRKPRHDGWTPERQKAFIEALADTGSVQTACRIVNMSPEGAYYLRRQPGAESFRRAWEAALDFGVQRLKDEAFERAMNGQLVPVFVAGKLMGFRRKKNDRLLMFCLRHYGQDANGRRVTINYFSSRATAGAAAPGGTPQTRSGARRSARDAGPDRPTTGKAVSIDVTDSLRDGTAAAEASTTTVKTIISGNGQASAAERDDAAAALLDAFEGVPLDERAQSEILAALEAAAIRRRALEKDPESDPERSYVAACEVGDYAGELESGFTSDNFLPFREGELRWQGMGEGGENDEIERVLAEIEARRRLPAEEQARFHREEKEAVAAEHQANRNRTAALKQIAARQREDPNYDPLDWRNYEGGERGL